VCREVVCGVISGVIKEVLFPSADTPVKCGYIFSLRVHPDYRYAMASASLLVVAIPAYLTEYW
jgi:hypothetical protein